MNEARLGGYSVKSMLDRNMLFIHIPKCGGTYFLTKIFGSLGGGHLRAIDYKLMLGSSFDELHKIAVLRNPYERLYSIYRHINGSAFRSCNEVRSVFVDRFLGCTFEDFVMRLTRSDIYSGYLIFQPQYLFVCHPLYAERILVDEFIVLDDLQEYMKDVLGEDFSDNFGFRNESGKDRFTPIMYSNEMRSRVEEMYKEDFDLWRSVSS